MGEDYNQRILTKAIKKAIAGGFKAKSDDLKVDDCLIDWKIGGGVTISIGYEVLIYMHDFAKALWPKDGFPIVSHRAVPDLPARKGRPALDHRTTRSVKGSWQYHLQEMVISDHPIKYLGEHL